MKKKTCHIHLDMPVDWRFGRDILRGLLDVNRAGRFGWGVTCGLWKQEDVWFLTQGQPPDAVVGSFYDATRAAAWRSRRIPLINISGCSREPSGVYTVTADNVTVGRLAAEHFLQHGFRSFAYVSDNRRPVAELRRKGFREAIGKTTPLVELDDFTREGVDEFLFSLPPMTAIFCYTDHVARYVITALEQSGRMVPESFAVLGVDDDPIESGLSPVPISSVDIRPYEIGKQAGMTLHKLLAGLRCPRRQLLPPGKVITRKSTERMAIEDAAVAVFLRRIRERACERVRVKDLLEPRYGSRRAMEMKFKQYVGRTIEEEIRRCRLEAAREMLQTTSLSLAQVAEACGFCNSPHFSRMFKAAYGSAPGQYRK